MDVHGYVGIQLVYVGACIYVTIAYMCTCVEDLGYLGKLRNEGYVGIQLVYVGACIYVTIAYICVRVLKTKRGI